MKQKQIAAADDPFACFGDSSSSNDDDDDDDGDDDDGGILNAGGHHNNNDDGNDDDDCDRDRARRLVERYNEAAVAAERHRPTSRIDLAAEDAATSSPSSFHSSFADQAERTSRLPWPINPPLYLGPMDLSYSLEVEGGGRGYVASRDLSPGTLVLVEEPLVDGWPETQIGRRLGMESIKYILKREDANAIVRCMEEMHPTRTRVNDVLRRRRRRTGRDGNVDDADGGGLPSKRRGTASGEATATKTAATCDDNLDEAQIAGMMSAMERDANHVNAAMLLVSYAIERSVTNSDGSSMDMDDLGRMLLAMRYNGFDSGLYLHFSMFNHAEGEWRGGVGGEGQKRL
jgi:hypothetical protein